MLFGHSRRPASRDICTSMCGTPFFGELAFDSGFEDSGFVAFEVGLDALEVGNGFIKPGELFFDFCDDAFLLFKGGNGYWELLCLGT